MIKFLKASACMAALALVFGILSTTAQAAETGTIKGKVVGKDGNAVKGVAVRLTKPQQRRPAGNQASLEFVPVLADEKPAADAPKDPPPQPPPGGRQRPTPIKEATTGDDGTFTMTEVPVGEYALSAGSREGGAGVARQMVTVTAGGTAEVSLKLADPPARGGNRPPREGAGDAPKPDAPKPDAK